MMGIIVNKGTCSRRVSLSNEGKNTTHSDEPKATIWGNFFASETTLRGCCFYAPTEIARKRAQCSFQVSDKWSTVEYAAWINRHGCRAANQVCTLFPWRSWATAAEDARSTTVATWTVHTDVEMRGSARVIFFPRISPGISGHFPERGNLLMTHGVMVVSRVKTQYRSGRRSTDFSRSIFWDLCRKIKWDEPLGRVGSLGWLGSVWQCVLRTVWPMRSS